MSDHQVNQASQPTDADMLCVSLKALSRHVKACPAYRNLIGDMEYVDKAITALQSSAPLVTPQDEPWNGHHFKKRIDGTWRCDDCDITLYERKREVAMTTEQRLREALFDRAIEAYRKACETDSKEDWQEAASLAKALAAPSQAQDTPSLPEPAPWRCFHCDETFTDATSAGEHFGTRYAQEPACQIDIAKYREMETRMFSYNDEDAEIHREMYAMRSKHSQALIREEEKGYARGLDDGMKLGAPSLPEPGVAWPKRIFLVHDEVDCMGLDENCIHDADWCADRINDSDIEYVRADLTGAQPLALEVDKGPWKYETEAGKAYLASEDFTHDVILYMTGDFSNDEERRKYGEALAAKLNALPSLPVPTAEQPQRLVVCAANAYKDLIVLGARHFDEIMHKQIAQNNKALLVKPSAWEQGFIDQWGVFMDRCEAFEVATAAGQINTRRLKTSPPNMLFSEDIY